MNLLLIDNTSIFQLTRSRGARQKMTTKDILDEANFNSRAHVERDKRAEYIAKRRAISTHALTWSATFTNCHSSVCPPNFNSRAHVERDFFIDLPLLYKEISTHALTWSATCLNLLLIDNTSIFQLTRSRGARQKMTTKDILDEANFNSRAHVERDKRAEYIAKRRAISTHALTWSATFTNCHSSVCPPNFNSRAHVERDNNWWRCNNARKDFNSRAHVERDLRSRSTPLSLAISTHALTWSATTCVC